ncbi:putative MFS family arabinose efflux permease [Fontibacillus phaseoli]|uniref:Putative MFS family arabinose efflux permease n=1 Tax=Fontibacillus phaseoli TaxID=1416533 RepID=A0A369BHJ7_9BACL|nr:MFS transporter [Fontibacillus phaseoli]RCX19154.1 putative MFS family arabinose efflux permease [Fontibacillus phaseoli]
MSKHSSHFSSSLYNPLWISISCGLYWFAFSLTRPIISLYASSLGMEGIGVGAVLAVYSLMPLIAAIPGGLIADRLGRTFVLRIGSVTMLASGLLYWLSSGPGLLALAQLLAGLGQMAVWLAVQVLITEGPKQGSESRFATFSLYMALGQMIAPVLSGFLSDHYGYSVVFAGYTLTSLLLILTAWRCKESAPDAAGSALTKISRLPENKGRHAKTAAFFQQCAALLKNRYFAVILLTTFISLFILDVRTTYLPIQLQSLEMSNTKVGLLVSAGALSAVFVRPIYPLLMARLPFSRLLILTYAVSLLLMFVTPLLTNYYALMALVLITGLALGINQPMTLSMIASSTAPEERGLGIGLRLMANRAAQLMNPLLFGAFTSMVNLGTAFLLVGLILLLSCSFTVWLYSTTEAGREKSVRSEDLPAGKTSPRVR